MKKWEIINTNEEKYNNVFINNLCADLIENNNYI